MNWTQITRRGRLSVLPNVYSMEAVTAITKQLLNNVCYKKILLTFEKRDMYAFVDTESHDQIQQHGLKEVRKNPKMFDHVIYEIQILAKEWLHWLKTLEPQTKTNKELIEIYLKYRHYYQEVYGRYFTILILENPMTAHLNSILKEKAPEDKRAEYFTILTSTIEAMHSKREERDRLQLALKIKKYSNLNFLENPEINAWINHHTENYFWLTRDYEDQHLTKEDFIKKIQQNLEEDDLEKKAHHALHEEKLHHNQIVSIEAELNLTAEEKEFFRIMRAGIFLKELRKSIVSESLIYFDRVLDEICKRTRLTIELARMLLPHDMPALLIDNKPYKEILQKRFNKSVYLIQDGRHIAYTGKEAEKWFNELIKIDKDIQEIQGIPASAGVASGPARIVLHPSDFNKVKQGDIMITVQAVPSFLQAIKKCKALVADGGTGITSHPATLAREAKIPCVINAKIATNIITDGEFIEVDGNKGIVRRVKEESSLNDFPCKNLICANDEPDMNLFTIGPHIQGMHHPAIKKRIGTCMTTLAGEYRKKRMWFYIIKEESEEYGKKAFEKIQQNKTLIISLCEEIKKCAEKTHKLGEKLRKKQWNLSKEKECNVFDELYENHAHACMVGYVTVVADLENQLITNYAFDELTKAVEKTHAQKSVNEYFAILTAITEDTAARKEQLALLELAKKIQKNNLTEEQKDKELKNIHYNFCWANFGYNGPEKIIEKYEEELQEALKKDAEKELIVAKKEKQEVIQKQKEYITELQLSEEQIYAVECVKNTTLTKLVRKDFMAYSCFIFYLLFEETRKKYDLTLEELQFLTPYEARKILQRELKPDKKELQKRNEYCVYLYNNGKEKVLYDTEAEEFLKKHIVKEKVENVSELKGMAVYLGKVIGRAVIVNTKEDMHKIKEGDILVSYATSPEILPAMKKAAAFVTDLGGATCHAAIVAREMKKPCIIGTKIATKVLKDNDMIEVDAYTGIIKKIQETATKVNAKDEEYWIKNGEDDNVSLYPSYNFFLAAYHKMPEEAGVQLTKGAIEFKDNRFYWFSKMPDWKNVGEQLTEKTIADKTHFFRLKQRLLAHIKKMNDESEEIAKKDVASMTIAELNKEYQSITNAMQDVWGAGVPLVLFDFDYTHVSNKLITILENKTQCVQEVLSILTTPDEETAVKKEENAFLNIIEAAQNKGKEHPDVKKALHAHYEQYKWINHSWNGPDSPYSFFEKKLSQKINPNIKEEIQKREQQKQETSKKRKQLEQELKLNEEEKRLFEIGRDIVFLKAHRKEHLFKALSCIEQLLR